jgi:hypothetical protein
MAYRTESRIRLLAGTAAVVMAVGAVLGGCGSGAGSGGVPTASGTGASTPTTALTSAGADQLFVDYVHCVRSHGVTISDPTQRPGHSGLSLSLPDAATPGFAAANAACQHIIAPVQTMKRGSQGAPSQATMTALIAYARCMRGHDIPMLDPAASDGHIRLGSVDGIDNDIGRSDPQFSAADTACRHLLPAGTPDDGTGPP